MNESTATSLHGAPLDGAPVELLYRMDDLGKRLGMQTLAFGPSGTCKLVFDQTWVLTIVWHARTQSVRLHCPLCQARPQEAWAPQTLLTMLQNNFVGQNTGGGMLSIAPDRRAYITLELSWQEICAGALHDAIESLLQQAETWSTRLNESPDLDQHTARDLAMAATHRA